MGSGARTGLVTQPIKGLGGLAWSLQLVVLPSFHPFLVSARGEDEAAGTSSSTVYSGLRIHGSRKRWAPRDSLKFGEKTTGPLAGGGRLVLALELGLWRQRSVTHQSQLEIFLFLFSP